MSMIWSFRAEGSWVDERGVNLLDTGAPFYDSYETADGRFIAIGSIEPQFYARLTERLGLASEFGAQMDRSSWPALKEKLTALFRTRTRDEWCALMEPADICFAPVLSLEEAPKHPHNLARGTFVVADDVVQPAPAPRYSLTPTLHPAMPVDQSASDAILASAGYAPHHRDALHAQRIVG
jgi:alpha-methylacyl-CoA racemase